MCDIIETERTSMVKQYLVIDPALLFNDYDWNKLWYEAEKEVADGTYANAGDFIKQIDQLHADKLAKELEKMTGTKAWVYRFRPFNSEVTLESTENQNDVTILHDSLLFEDFLCVIENSQKLHDVLSPLVSKRPIFESVEDFLKTEGRFETTSEVVDVTCTEQELTILTKEGKLYVRSAKVTNWEI